MSTGEIDEDLKRFRQEIRNKLRERHRISGMQNAHNNESTDLDSLERIPIPPPEERLGDYSLDDLVRNPGDCDSEQMAGKLWNILTKSIFKTK